MPFLFIALGIGAVAYFLSQSGQDSIKALADRSRAISSGGALFFPILDTKPDEVVTVGAPAWVYEEDPQGVQSYFQLAVVAIPPTGHVDFGLAGPSGGDIYLPRSHFALGSPKAS